MCKGTNKMSNFVRFYLTLCYQILRDAQDDT